MAKDQEVLYQTRAQSSVKKDFVPHPRPVLKWPGGKRSLFAEIYKRIPSSFYTYVEPFAGAGAILFGLTPLKALINDVNPELMNLYRVLLKHPEALIKSLKQHKNDKDYFYQVREKDRKQSYARASDVEKASRMIFLNKTCFNGLYRVNSKGQFNSPYGYYKNPKIADVPNIRAVSKFLNTCEIEIKCEDFTETLGQVGNHSFVYCDPPYIPVSETSNFTGYSKNGFGMEDQIRLRDALLELDKRGGKFMLSNSDTPATRQLYSGFKIEVVKVGRAINAVGSKRGAINEVLIRNYSDE